jgi:hypothetical protein|tara:strand:- start:1829 stop:2086 length:258 start_codon:yes stop_codon:yes gene_type:complete
MKRRRALKAGGKRRRPKVTDDCGEQKTAEKRQNGVLARANFPPLRPAREMILLKKVLANQILFQPGAIRCEAAGKQPEKLPGRRF